LHRVYDRRCDYHSKSIRRLHVSREYLERLIQYYIDNKYEIISLDSVYEILTENKKTNKFVSFTFDDGYKDNYEIAYPLFKKHNAPFAIYISSGNPSGKNINWPFMLDELIYRNSEISLSFEGKTYHFKTDTLSSKENSYNSVVHILNNCEKENRQDLLDKIFSPYGFDIHSYSKNLFLTWQEIKELSRSDIVTIGSHTVNHYELARLGHDEVQEEIVRCRETIEANIGKRVDHFAFPFGCKPAIGSREFNIAKKCTFKTCTSTWHGYIHPEHKRCREKLPRVTIHEGATRGSIDVHFNSAIDGIMKRKFHPPL